MVKELAKEVCLSPGRRTIISEWSRGLSDPDREGLLQKFPGQGDSYHQNSEIESKGEGFRRKIQASPCRERNRRRISQKKEEKREICSRFVTGGDCRRNS